METIEIDYKQFNYLMQELKQIKMTLNEVSKNTRKPYVQQKVSLFDKIKKVINNGL